MRIMKDETLRRIELERWQLRAKVSNATMAELLEVHRVTYSRWMHGRQPVPRWTTDWLAFRAPRLPLPKSRQYHRNVNCNRNTVSTVNS